LESPIPGSEFLGKQLNVTHHCEWDGTKDLGSEFKVEEKVLSGYSVFTVNGYLSDGSNLVTVVALVQAAKGHVMRPTNYVVVVRVSVENGAFVIPEEHGELFLTPLNKIANCEGELASQSVKLAATLLRTNPSISPTPDNESPFNASKWPPTLLLSEVPPGGRQRKAVVPYTTEVTSRTVAVNESTPAKLVATTVLSSSKSRVSSKQAVSSNSRVGAPPSSKSRPGGGGRRRMDALERDDCEEEEEEEPKNR
jgi:hypothetical protein